MVKKIWGTRHVDTPASLAHIIALLGLLFRGRGRKCITLPNASRYKNNHDNKLILVNFFPNSLQRSGQSGDVMRFLTDALSK